MHQFLKLLVLISITLALSCQSSKQHDLITNSFKVSIDHSGKFSRLTDLNKNQEYNYLDPENILLAIQVNGEPEYPSSAFISENDDLITLSYSKNKVEAKVKYQNKQEYLTFELVEINDHDKIELVSWGPIKTTINETIGETIGVVRNKDFSIGIQSLNPRTLGGFPTDDDNAPSYNIFGTTSLVDVSDSLDILYRGHTAYPRDYGSSLQAYTRNRSNDRIISNLNHKKYVAPAFKDKGVVGSKIALFGCAPDEVLNIIEKIELNEGLPHPTLNGVWAKRATEATSAYLIQGFGVHNMKEAIDLTKKAGLKYLYQGGPFENWGQFKLRPTPFPKNWESMKECVDMAKKEGIKLGLHTLSNFITTNDPYVSPVPDKRLAIVGSTTLTKDVGEESTQIEIEDPTYFNQMENNNLHAVVIGDEIIRYEAVSDTAPWTLINCERGAFNTIATKHEDGQKIDKLIDHGYKTFLSNAELTVEMAGTLADLYNKTGLKQISFDGLEGNLSTGMGEYGELLMTKTWFDQLAPDIKNDYIMDASRPGHYFWHMFTRMNWGEPWYAGFRESQTSYRLLNQDYFRRNFIPCMLGWFSMRDNTSLEDIEWMLARSAAFDAGYALVTSQELVEKNGFGNEILEKINQWEQARMSKAFTADQKKRMEDIKAEFTLKNLSKDYWELIPLHVQRFEHQLKIRQPGEPVWSSFQFDNVNEAQQLQFILSTTNNSSASSISIEIDDFRKIELDLNIQAQQYVKYDGGQELVLYDKSWNKISEVKIDPDKFKLKSGLHQIKVDCQFTGSDQASLKLELKTQGKGEKVKKK